jgi:hypothetical protein
MRTILAILIGGAIGAAIGGSKVLCADGTCVLTGSWYGGALLGSMAGLLLVGGCPACAAGRVPGACRVGPGESEAGNDLTVEERADRD